ncbi:C45 family peptidase [Rhodococcus sp. H29-C3]|uniref:C45 family autoproteolytic acyltransferase/hydolase n=1 Tax=Rhodococcus sp. H29-C3 TaxID=3046307 RepID=UPI0024B920D1|nr:C45 family peptidase [Rhodococcus sp. H29-C3]MDJ0361926.1 C45 family autoproteolytic acyltransferase/hydrolase [Rhodococcus sp. H29-C3]
MTSVNIREQSVAGLRWLVVSGEREAAFRALGEHTRENIVAVQNSMPEREDLRRFTTTGGGRHTLAAVVEATAREYPEQVAELRALAEGAGVDYQSILLANLRGDVGVDDGTGCTDMAWHRKSSFVAHNEDGAPALLGHFMLLTLEIDGQQPVTAQWYPGFSPANAFVANAAGLIWGINHIQVAEPIYAPGRHFIARALQQCTSFEGAIDYLRTHPSAGGFAYTIGESGTGRSATVETVAGRVAVRSATEESPLQWHTNHVRFLPCPPDMPTASGDGAATGKLGQYSESMARGKVLEGLSTPAAEPDAAWFQTILSSEPVPCGVHRTAAGNDPLMTLCTTVADLTRERLHIRGADGATAEIALPAFARGELS